MSVNMTPMSTEYTNYIVHKDIKYTKTIVNVACEINALLHLNTLYGSPRNCKHVNLTH